MRNLQEVLDFRRPHTYGMRTALLRLAVPAVHVLPPSAPRQLTQHAVTAQQHSVQHQHINALSGCTPMAAAVTQVTTHLRRGDESVAPAGRTGAWIPAARMGCVCMWVGTSCNASSIVALG